MNSRLKSVGKWQSFWTLLGIGVLPEEPDTQVFMPVQIWFTQLEPAQSVVPELTIELAAFWKFATIVESL